MRDAYFQNLSNRRRAFWKFHRVECVCGIFQLMPEFQIWPKRNYSRRLAHVSRFDLPSTRRRRCGLKSPTASLHHSTSTTTTPTPSTTARLPTRTSAVVRINVRGIGWLKHKGNFFLDLQFWIRQFCYSCGWTVRVEFDIFYLFEKFLFSASS